jgi:hypothetical protein
MTQAEATDKKILRSKCCCCERPVGKHGKHINFVNLHHRADWDFPAWGNFLNPQGRGTVLRRNLWD